MFFKANNLLRRTFTYETLVFVYAVILAWMIFGHPWKSLLLTIIITVTKYPLYYWFHKSWRDK